MKRNGRNIHTISARYGRRPSAAHTKILSLLIGVPAFLLSCTDALQEETLPYKTQIYIHKTAKTTAGTLDLFFFNEDALLTLDAYQRFSNPLDGRIDAASRSGDKWVAGILNMPGDIWSWSDVNTFQRLSERVSDLTEEQSGRPVMTGLCRIRAGRDRQCTLDLKPLTSRILLHSLCVDFHARPYRGAVLEDVDVYLVNVNRTVRLFDDGTATVPSTWLNMGEREEGSPICHLGRVEGTVLPSAEFFCYPNSTVEEGLGRPLTRLVIEATMMGQRYFYPVNLPEIGRSETLSLDITLTRTGTAGPDEPAGSGSVQCHLNILPWEEMEPWTVLF